MKSKLLGALIATVAILAASDASASVTIAIKTSGYGNATTASTNGMAWGVVISSTGAAFSGSTTSDLAAALEGFTIPALGNPTTPVQIGTTGYYFSRAVTDTSSSGPPTFTNGYMNTVNFNLGGAVGSGDPLGLLWFSEGTTTSGSHFGFQDLSYNTPSDGANVTSGFTASGTLGNLTIGAAPEPSRALLLGFGALGFMMRRRRK